LASLEGEKGDKGDAGLSTYEEWLAAGNTGTEADFLASLKGEKGDKGDAGMPPFYMTRLQAEGASVPAEFDVIGLRHNSQALWYERSTSAETALQTGDGAHWRPLGPTACFEHWGAAGNNTGDDRLALRDAIESGMTLRNALTSVYRCTDEVVADNGADVDLEGGTILFARSSAGAGMIIRVPDHNTAQTVRLDNLKVFTTNALTDTAIRIDMATAPTNLDGESRRHPTVQIGRGMYIGGEDAGNVAQYFSASCLHLDNRTHCMIEGGMYRGPTGDQIWTTGTRGITFSGSGDPTNLKLDQVNVRHVEYAVMIEDDCEGISLVDCQLVAVRQGVKIIGQEPGDQNLGFFIRGCHINAETACIDIHNGAEIFIVDNELYNLNLRETNPWDGIRLGVHSGADKVMEFRIEGNQFNGQNAPDPATYAIRLGALTEEGHICDNKGRRLYVGVEVSAITTRRRIYVRDNFWKDQNGGQLTNVQDSTGLSNQTQANNKVFAAFSY
ncbi:hypothetical protein ATO8_19989, partial [Roseivivax marinus]